MRVALVHDWLTGMRGGEKALEVLAEQFPDAELFTLLYVPGAVSAPIERLPRHTSAIQWLPGARRAYRHYLPLFPTAIEWLDLDGFDLVVSTSHCVAKAVIAPGARHLCYCLTPMRYAWDQFDAYFGPARLGAVASGAAGYVMRRLARWDRATAGRVSRYVAISRYVARRIHRYYNRRADIVYPPVDTRFFHPDGRVPESYVLIVSALVPYKRIDVAVEAAHRTGTPLKVVGDGPERARLQQSAGSSVEWLGACSDETIRELYRGAAAVLLPGEEDFGIAPLEAQACGRPVVALARGGALETVVPGRTGILVEDGSPDGFAEGLRTCLEQRFDAAVIRRHAEEFSRERFGAELRACIDDTMASPPGTRW
jgi:glycosyltransferase involved in cell wall biosynthesis